MPSPQKRSENQTFPGNWIVLVFFCSLFLCFTFFNVKIFQAIDSQVKCFFSLFNYGFLLGWFFFSIDLCQQISIMPSSQRYTERKWRAIFPKKESTVEKSGKIFSAAEIVCRRDSNLPLRKPIFIAITNLFSSIYCCCFCCCFQFFASILCKSMPYRFKKNAFENVLNCGSV